MDTVSSVHELTSRNYIAVTSRVQVYIFLLFLPIYFQVSMLRQFNPLVRSQARVTHVVSYNVKSRLRFSSSSRQYAKQNKYHSALYLALFGGTFAVVSYFISDNPIHNDGNMQMEPDSKPSKKNKNTHGLDLEDEHLTTLIWGSNRYVLDSINLALPSFL